ncbi:hypothetical protein Tco_1509480 [Tanacetum coccineum]
MGMVLFQSLQIHQDKLRFCLLELQKKLSPEKEREKQGPPCLWNYEKGGGGKDHLAKFHKMTDAKEMWDAIKSRFGGNDESKKMQKYILKQQFEGFFVSNTEGLHKGYDRFQSLLSQLEIHGAGVSTKGLIKNSESWSDIKGSTASSSSSPQNVAFVSENTNSTNEVSTAYCVPNLSGQNTKYEQTSSYSLLANQSSFPQLDMWTWNSLMITTLEDNGLEWNRGHDFTED